MSDATKAMTKLGQPCVTCRVCGTTALATACFFALDAITAGAVFWTAASVAREPERHYCSLFCVTRDESGLAERWPPRRFADAQFRIATIYRWNDVTDHPRALGGLHTGGQPLRFLWLWNDTGNGIWIEENVARLRASGELA